MRPWLCIAASGTRLTLVATVALDRYLLLHICHVHFTVARTATEQNRVIVQTIVHKDEITNRSVVMCQFDFND